LVRPLAIHSLSTLTRIFDSYARENAIVSPAGSTIIHDIGLIILQVYDLADFMPYSYYTAQKKVAAEGLDWPPHIETVSNIENTRSAIDKRLSVMHSLLETHEIPGSSHYIGVQTIH
jgi:hypothetical protein